MKTMETRKRGSPGRMERSWFTMRETRRFGDKQIRICVLTAATDSESGAVAGNQLSTPEPIHALK